MKMSKLFLPIVGTALCLLSITSCTETNAPVVTGTELKTVLINVTQNTWVYSNVDNNNYFYATVNMPEITEDVFDYGIVKMYRVFNYEYPDASQIELPYIRHNEYHVGGDNWAFYTETVDYEFGIGNMTIYYTASDFDYEIDQTFVPDAMQFRCVICW